MGAVVQGYRVLEGVTMKDYARYPHLQVHTLKGMLDVCADMQRDKPAFYFV